MEQYTDLKQVAERIAPNMIHNRFDLIYSKECCSGFCPGDDQGILIPAHWEGTTASLGLWLGDVTAKQLEDTARFIFKTHKNVKRIQYQNCFCDYGDAVQKNHFRIILPSSVEELRNRLSSKGRYNIQREKKILERDFGSWQLEEYTAQDVPADVFPTYFRMKEATHGTNYRMTQQDYIKKYFVSHVYVLRTEEGIAAIVLSCEQCPIVYLENLTYDQNLAKYSPGQIIYDLFLERMIEKGKIDLYLAGGNLSYKKRYGSIEETVYDGVIYRNQWVKRGERIAYLLRKAAEKIYSNGPEFIRKAYKRIRG